VIEDAHLSITHAFRESGEALCSASIVARCVGLRRGGIGLAARRHVGVMQTFVRVLPRHTGAMWS
jgi:hypothetical protein